ncbi:MAG: membrane protein [Alphaproteobacteria bacterium]|nr:MAG: membrane protein [Alphaproteobacteria bacterium]
MKNLFVFFFFFVMSCESYLYDDYKIIDYKKRINRDDTFKNNVYNVRKGDNLYSISRKFNASIEELIKFNKIQEPYKIFPNQSIFIPLNQKHKVVKGETLYSISRYYETTVFTLAKYNNIKNVNNIKVGKELIIPKGIKKKEKIKEKKWDSNFKTKQIDKKKNETLRDKQSSKFIWPVKGKLLSKYGKSKEGFYNDGINIDSKKGTKVKSSKAGKVIYCGNEIPGYGNLILIKHSKNWITAYAHLNEVFTEKGKKVVKGETIGSVGNTGNVRSPQLHFEIRKGKESVNPLKLL